MLDPKTMQSGRYRLTCDVKNLLGSTLATGAVFDVDRNEGEGGVFELVAWSGRHRQPLAFGRGGSWSFVDGSMGLGAAMLAALEAMPADAAPATAEPTPRERGQNTCRAALMTVIGLHRRGDGLLDAAPFIVAAVQALMDLDGLRAGEAADLDVAKERDDARALAEGLTRGQDDLRRKLKAITGDRDLAVEDRDYARERMNKAEAEVASLRTEIVNTPVAGYFESKLDRAMRILGWCDEPPEEWAQATIDDVQVLERMLERMLQRALDRKKRP